MNDLGVAAALKVKYTSIAPAVFVITNKGATRVRRERCLTRAGKTEEERYVLSRADVGRAVHRENILLRQQVVEHGKDRLFDFTGVLSTSNQHKLLPEMNYHENF